MKKKDEFTEALEAKKVSNLATAMVLVMNDVKSIDKAMTVGQGRNSYSGVADKDVKYHIGSAMAKYGLTCVPVKIEPTVKIERWEETNQYGTKMKQSVFTEVLATYRITHAETNESVEVMGYGHGVDSMDKSAGKATTYALKNALLYSFLVPTGSIDDTDATHSSSVEVPRKSEEWTEDKFQEALKALTAKKITKDWLIANRELTVEQLAELENY